MKTSAYLFFDGNCAQAFEFYARTFPGTGLQIMRQSSMDKTVTADKDGVMHAYLKVGDADLMASDMFDHGYTRPQGMNVALNVDTAAEADRIFAALADGGQIVSPIAETFFAYRFGVVTDRFGTPWMVVASKPMG